MHEWTKEMKAAAMQDAQKVCDLTDMLREVRAKGLIYWEPNTDRGHLAKASMLSRISALID